MQSLRFVAGVVLLSLVAAVASAAPTALDLARQQFAEFYLGSTALPDGNLTLKDTNEAGPEADRAREFARALRPDGSWADIDYHSTARSSWPPSIHYTRMLAMIAVARRGEAGAPEAAALEAAVHRAFAFWIQNDFTCPNWWYNQIGAPKLMATVGLLLGDRLTDAERRYLTDVMLPRAKIGMTGQNRVWLAGNALMLGMLRGDESPLAEAAAAIWSEVVITTGEGIQPDFSFHQHGPQQQFGNYGMALAVEICRWGTILRGTPWAIPSPQLAAYRGFLLDGEAWVNWRGRMDISACGRQFMPGSPVTKAETITQVMQNVALFDSARADDYRAFVRRNVAGGNNDLVGDRYFWRSDYLIHRTPEYAATLKLSSRRVIGAESLNSENLLGYHLGDGALYLYRRGDEYEEIFPVWDWQTLPGVTCAQRAGGPPSFREVRGERDFVGGVTNGRQSLIAFDFARDGVQAKKSWAFAANAIVCLGTEIRSAAEGAPVVTTLNQCLCRGPVTVKFAGREPKVFEGDQSLADVEWVEHDGWRYSFAIPTAVHLRVGPRTGDWKRVFNNPATPPGDITRDVFSLMLEHGTVEAMSEGYLYFITPSGATGPRPMIIENSTSQQGVWFGEGKGAVAFWRAGACDVTSHVRVAADKPCVVLVDEPAQRLWVADPTQKLDRVKLTVRGKTHDVALPQAGDAGRSVELKLSDG